MARRPPQASPAPARERSVTLLGPSLAFFRAIGETGQYLGRTSRDESSGVSVSTVVAIGATHRSAPLALLERLTIDDTLLPKYLDDLVSRDHINEAVIISTCNRIEIFVTAEKFHGAYRDVRDFISDVTFTLPEEFADHLEVSHDADAVRHRAFVAPPVPGEQPQPAQMEPSPGAPRGLPCRAVAAGG